MSQLLSFNSDGFQYAWDSTSLTAFVTCPRKYYYSNLLGWTAELRSVHLEFGGHYAKSLERYHKLRAKGLGYLESVREITRLLLIETWEHDTKIVKLENASNFTIDELIQDNYVCIPEIDPTIWRLVDSGKPTDWMHNTKTRDTLVRSVVWYLDQFKDDPMQTYILANGEAAVEYSFSFELSPDYLYCGHIDRLVIYGEDKDIYVQDQKTSGATVTPKFFNNFSPDTQMTGYTLAGQIIFGLPVKGVVVDAAQIAVGFTAFSRGFISRSTAQLEEFREEALHYIEEAKRCHEEKYYPMRRTSCGNYGGCEFQKVCSMTPVLRDKMLEGNFKKRKRWDPLERR